VKITHGTPTIIGEFACTNHAASDSIEELAGICLGVYCSFGPTKLFLPRI
jgi:hypothetical protein